MRRLPRNTGFTLQELIVAIAVMGVVTTLAAVMYSQMADQWRMVRNRALLDSRADHIFEQMQEDFSAVLSPRLSGRSIEGISQNTRDDERFWETELADDQIILPVVTPTVSFPETAGAAVMYRIDRDNGLDSLMRVVGRLGGGQPQGLRTEIARGVTRMRIEYARKDGAGGWIPEWKDRALPGAVRVSLMLVDDPKFPGEQISRKKVFTIPVD